MGDRITQQKDLSFIKALWGAGLLILIVSNMLVFQYGGYDEHYMDLFSFSELDQWLYLFINNYVKDSVTPMLSFIFGLSMMTMHTFSADYDSQIKVILYRCFLFLIVLGLLHAFFIWDGDILLYLGMMGLFLTLFIHHKPRTWLVWGVLLLGIQASISLLPDHWLYPSGRSIDHGATVSYMKTSEVLASQPYLETRTYLATEGQLREAGQVYPLALVLSPFLTAPMFLFGMYAARKNMLDHVKSRFKSYLWATIVCMLTGVMFKTIDIEYAEGWFAPIGAAGERLAGAFIGFGVIGGFALIYCYAKLSWMTKVWSKLEAVGQLSLTNYLSQSIVSTWLFYGYGLSWFGKIGVVYGICLSLLIYIGQLYISEWYLKYYHNGGLEWLLYRWTFTSWFKKVKSNMKFPIEKKDIPVN